MARVGADSFLRRPSMRMEAIETISGFMNHSIMARIRPFPDFSYDAAALFLLKDKASWVISGTGAVLIFVDGELYARSAAKPYPCFGLSHAYKPELPETVTLPGGVRDKAALLLLCGACPEETLLQGIREKLLAASSPEEWLNGVMTGGLSEKTALAAFLPPKKKLFSL